MGDRGDVLKKNFPSHARTLGTREHQQPTAIEMEPEQSPGAVPAGFSSTGTKGEEDEDRAREVVPPSQ